MPSLNPQTPRELLQRHIILRKNSNNIVLLQSRRSLGYDVHVAALDGEDVDRCREREIDDAFVDGGGVGGECYLVEVALDGVGEFEVGAHPALGFRWYRDLQPFCYEA